ncbi:MAG: Stk1 family PASTA domain-containing Ser/Thr kinase [Clostridiales bacterium]|nr:Stk1 family PASTA domain-containing Ser/Thr kinase [Clostridiales bacterium]
MDNYVGKRLDGRYEIQEIIGVGGMAVVYKAYDNIDDRIVAVKILKEEFLANEDFRRRFKNESKAIAVLSHPNIVKVYDVSYGDRLQYIVMEYVEGITLKEYIEQQGRINWKESVYFVTQILRALQHAHDKGVVHRDIKPQNIMLLENGTIKVTDFGIARFSMSETRTMTDMAIGSVHYISPEQARGDITDNKSDIYSVGVVLYEMLTGQLPFQSESSVSVALMQLQSEAKRPREINPSIPVGLEQITVKAMQKRPQDRYQSAAEMLLDIDEFRRNPSMKFEHNYYVDNQPTKFVEKTSKIPLKNTGAQRIDVYPEPDEDEYYDDDDDSKSRTLPILFGIIGGLLVLAGIIFAICFAAGVFSGGTKVNVPRFIGMNYFEDIKDDPDYSDFVFETDETAESDSYDPGYVYDQSPSEDEKISKGEKIKLFIYKEKEKDVVPDVYGYDYSEAITLLTSSGFRYKLEYEENSQFKENQVIRTVPGKGEDTYKNAEIVVYIAESSDTAIMPKVIDWDLNTAKELIESAGLTVSSTVETENSTKKKDTVIGVKNAKEEAVVSKSTEIILVVSSGIPPTSTGEVSFTLPNAGTSKTGKIKVFLDNELVDGVSNKTVLLNGDKYTFDVTSSDKEKKLVVLIDDIKVYECKMDFTQSPAKVSGELAYDYFENGGSGGENNERAFLPNVVGLSYDDAVSSLKEAGFEYIEPQYITTNDSTKDFEVYVQEPSSKMLTRYPVSTKITLTVYSYEASDPDAGN